MHDRSHSLSRQFIWPQGWYNKKISTNTPLDGSGSYIGYPLFTVKKRLDAGLLEVELKEKFADKTNWRKMLKGETENIDLRAQKEELVKNFKSKVDFEISNDDSYNFDFPVEEYPEKNCSLKL